MSPSFNRYQQYQLRQFNSDFRKIPSLRRGRNIDSVGIKYPNKYQIIKGIG